MYWRVSIELGARFYFHPLLIFRVMKKFVKEIQARVMPWYRGIAFAYGNAKLPHNHLIVNLNSAHHCPSAALGMCKVGKNCYALNEENVFRTYLNKNEQMEKFFDTASFEQIVELMTAYIDGAPDKCPIDKIRMNEAGDFKSQEQVDLISRVAAHFKETRGIETYAWSAREDLDFTNVSFILNGSNDGIKGALRHFIATPPAEFDALPHDKFVRCFGDCGKCHICHERKYKGDVYCRMHGSHIKK